LQIKFKGNEIPNGTQTTIAIINSGQAPVKREDFDTPINIDIEGGKLLSSQVIKTHPGNLDVSISHTEDRVTIKPLLLNPRDYILVSLLTDNKAEVSRLHARIAGINTIEEITANPSEVFAIKHIRPGDETGTTFESQLIRVPVTAAAFTCMVLAIVALYLFTTVNEHITAAQKIIRISLAVVLEITAAFILVIPNAYLTRELGLASWASTLVELILLAVCLIIALKMREVFHPPTPAS
jgi:hypothetical protein